jgi:hypothetical protein
MTMEPFVLVSKDYVQEMFTPQFPELYPGFVDPKNETCCYWRLCQQHSLLSYVTDGNNTHQSPCAIAMEEEV